MAETQGQNANGKQRRYTAEDIEAGLHALAIADGNHRIAHRLLAENDRDIPAATLWDWRAKRHTARYEQIRAEVLPAIKDRMAAEAETLAIAYAHLEREALEKLHDKLGDLNGKELATVANNAATGRGISTDKANILRDRPTHRVALPNADEILRRLGGALPGLIVDSTAEEIDTGTAQIEQPRQTPDAPALSAESDV